MKKQAQHPTQTFPEHVVCPNGVILSFFLALFALDYQGERMSPVRGCGILPSKPRKPEKDNKRKKRSPTPKACAF